MPFRESLSARSPRKSGPVRRNAVLLALLVLSVPALAPATQAEVPTGNQWAVTAALDYVFKNTLSTGAVASAETTPMAILALSAAEKEPWTWRRNAGSSTPCDFVATNPTRFKDSPSTTWSLLVMAIVSCGGDPRSHQDYDWLGHLLTFHSAGPPGTNYRQMGNANQWNDDMFAVLALRAARATHEAAFADAVDEVKRRQRADGGWTCCAANQQSDSEMTAAGVMALVAAGVRADDLSIRRALIYLDGVQNQDGSFPATQSHTRATAWTLMALSAAGEDPEGSRWRTPTGGTPAGYLKRAQLSNGGFALNANELSVSMPATLEAVLALSGRHHPVNHRLPVAIQWEPLLPRTLDIVRFEETANPEGTVRYAWHFPDATSTSPAPLYAFARPGLQSIHLTLRDDAGGLAHATSRVDVVNRPPSVNLTALPNATARGHDVVFTAITSDVDGVVTQARFDFGDGNSTDWLGDLSIRHRYERLGTYIASVTVRDDANATTAASAEVRIVNLPPVVEVAGDRVGNRSTAVRLTPAVLSDPEGGFVTHEWDLGDGNRTTDLHVAHRYERLGTYHVVLTAWDGEGARSRAHANVTIVNLPPTITQMQLSKREIVLGEFVDVDVRAEDPDGAGVARILYNFGDSDQWTETPRHRYLANGTYTVTVEAHDVDGGKATARETILVGRMDSTPPPVITNLSRAPERVRSGANVTFEGEVSGAGNVTRVLVRWRVAEAERYEEFHGEGRFVVDAGSFARGSVVDWWVEAWDEGNRHSASATRTFVVQAQLRPHVVAAVGPHEVRTGESVRVNLEGSGDEEGPAREFLVDWGDGRTATWTRESQHSHAYARPGTYTVTATVRNAEGVESDGWRTQIHVSNRVPHVRIQSPPEGHLALGNFRASGTATDADGHVVRVEATLNGARLAVDGTSRWFATVDVARLGPGSHSLVVVAYDDDGARSEAATARFVVPGPEPADEDRGGGSGYDDDGAAGGDAVVDGVGEREAPAAGPWLLIVAVLGSVALLRRRG